MIYLASFFGGGEGPRYSVARWAPRAFRGDAVELSFLGARHPGGAPLLQGVPPEEFCERYYAYLLTRAPLVRDWLHSLSAERDMTLCCWCTPERQEGRPKLFCHRVLVGHLIELYRPDVPVTYLDGAEDPVWEDNAAGPLVELLREGGA